MKISEEEYLRAKSIVESYERQEFEEGMREAEAILFEDEEEDDLFKEPERCEVCGKTEPHHLKGCIYDNPYSYEELGYD